MDKIFAQYYEDLLKAQYKVSEKLIKNQHLACGTIREEFLREILIKKRPSIKISKGFVGKGDTRSGECDQIFYHQDSPTETLGKLLFIKPEHCRLVLEIKSNATGSDLKKTNANFQKIKEIDPENKPLCGLFCYNSAIKKKAILRRFGWVFDKYLESWEEDLSLEMEYLHIDFIVCIACLEEDKIACLEEDKEYTEQQFFLIKDKRSQRFVLKQDYPIIKNFFGLTDNL